MESKIVDKKNTTTKRGALGIMSAILTTIASRPLDLTVKPLLADDKNDSAESSYDPILLVDKSVKDLPFLNIEYAPFVKEWILNGVKDYEEKIKKDPNIVELHKKANIIAKKINQKRDLIEKLGLDPKWADIILGMIYSESTFNLYPKSTSAVGPCQMEKYAIVEATQILQKISIKNLTNDNPDDNISLGIAYMSQEFKLYPDLTLAILAYNMGQKSLNEGIYQYMLNVKPDIENQLTLDFKNFNIIATAKYVKEYGINIWDLWTNKVSKKALMDTFYKSNNRNYTENLQYVFEVLAASSIFSHHLSSVNK